MRRAMRNQGRAALTARASWSVAFQPISTSRSGMPKSPANGKLKVYLPLAMTTDSTKFFGEVPDNRVEASCCPGTSRLAYSAC